MEQLLLIQFALAFIVGSTWVVLASIAAERLGPKLGGLIASLPSTVVVALLFIGVTQDANAVAAATFGMPISMGLLGAFTWAYAVAARKLNVVGAILCAVLFWFVVNIPIALFEIGSYALVLLLTAVLGFLFYYATKRAVHGLDATIQNKQYSFAVIVARALVGGFFITLAVVMANVSGPVVGGIFSAFPAMFASILSITHHQQGSEYSRVLAGSMLMTALINVTLYIIAAHIFYGVTMSVALGTVLSIGTSAIVTTILWKILKK